MTSTYELFWIRGALESNLFRCRARERGMFRDNHLDAGCAAHRLFTEKFGDPTLKPYRLSTSGIFQAYPTIPSEELKTHAAICADPLQHKVLLPERLNAKPMTRNWSDNVTLGFESMVRPIIGSQDNEHDELDHFTLRHNGNPSFTLKSTCRESLRYRINEDHGADLLEIYQVNPLYQHKCRTPGRSRDAQQQRNAQERRLVPRQDPASKMSFGVRGRLPTRAPTIASRKRSPGVSTQSTTSSPR